MPSKVPAQDKLHPSFVHSGYLALCGQHIGKTVGLCVCVWVGTKGTLFWPQKSSCASPLGPPLLWLKSYRRLLQLCGCRLPPVGLRPPLGRRQASLSEQIMCSISEKWGSRWGRRAGMRTSEVHAQCHPEARLVQPCHVSDGYCDYIKSQG